MFFLQLGQTFCTVPRDVASSYRRWASFNEPLFKVKPTVAAQKHRDTHTRTQSVHLYWWDPCRCHDGAGDRLRGRLRPFPLGRCCDCCVHCFQSSKETTCGRRRGRPSDLVRVPVGPRPWRQERAHQSTKSFVWVDLRFPCRPREGRRREESTRNHALPGACVARSVHRLNSCPWKGCRRCAARWKKRGNAARISDRRRRRERGNHVASLSNYIWSLKMSDTVPLQRSGGHVFFLFIDNWQL